MKTSINTVLSNTQNQYIDENRQRNFTRQSLQCRLQKNWKKIFFSCLFLKFFSINFTEKKHQDYNEQIHKKK